MTLDYSKTAAGKPLINDPKLQRILDMLAGHLHSNVGPVGPFMEFVLDLATAQYGSNLGVPDHLLYGASDDHLADNEALGIARGVIGEHLAAQRQVEHDAEQ